MVITGVREPDIAVTRDGSRIKQDIGFHGAMAREAPDFSYGDLGIGGHGNYDRGLITERGLQHVIACVEAMTYVLGDAIGLALDYGARRTAPDAVCLTLEPLHVLWLEDLITGNYTPYVNADVHREVTRRMSAPISTGEHVYLRQNIQQVIENHAGNIIGPDPCDVSGLARLK